MTERRSWIQEIFGGAIGGFSASLWRDLAKGEAKELGGTLATKIQQLIKQNPRVELLYVLLALEPEDAEKLWKRHLDAIREGTENDFIVALGNALPKNVDNTVDIERAKRIFSQLAKMEEAQFCQVIEELNHDPIAQKLRHWLKHGKNIAEAIVLTMAYTSGVAVRHMEKIDNKAAELAVKINERVDNPSRFGRIARRLIR